MRWDTPFRQEAAGLSLGAQAEKVASLCPRTTRVKSRERVRKTDLRMPGLFTLLPTPFPRWVIYNDQKVCASEKPPKDLGYIYFYQRVAS